jgi:hypothetical protein
MEPNEIDGVITLFNYYREAAAIPDDKYDENRLLTTLREYAIRSQLFLRIAYNGQRPIGIIGGFLSEDPVDTDFTANIQFCYLIPEFDNFDNYKELISVFTEWATACKVSAIRAIDIGSNYERLREVYERLDFDVIKINIMNKEIA